MGRVVIPSHAAGIDRTVCDFVCAHLGQFTLDPNVVYDAMCALGNFTLARREDFADDLRAWMGERAYARAVRYGVHR